MYEKLVKELRDCRNKAVFSEYWWDITTEAADAIEELLQGQRGERTDYKVLTVEYEAARAHEMMPRWIPVTERLPEKFQPVWVACKMDGRENWTFDTRFLTLISNAHGGRITALRKGKRLCTHGWIEVRRSRRRRKHD